MKSVFSYSETAIIISALTLYKNNAAPLMPLEKHNSLISSSSVKLNSISPLTFFTDEELSIMYFAVDYYISNISKPPRGTLKLLHRLKKYDPKNI